LLELQPERAALHRARPTAVPIHDTLLIHC
jgi:hypothetical protein